MNLEAKHNCKDPEMILNSFKVTFLDLDFREEEKDIKENNKK
jgi:hypothetical protein